MTTGVLAESWVFGIASTGIWTGIITALLWIPFKRLQGKGPIAKDNSSDLVGHMFVIDSDITSAQASTTQYSGINWRVELAPNANIARIPSGATVKVCSVEVGVFKVIPATASAIGNKLASSAS